MADQKWVHDAALIDVKKIENIIYINRSISRFLEEDGWMFLSANKGMGKSLILAYKRFRLQSTSNSAIFIPKNKPYLDNMGILPSLSKEKGAFLSQESIATRIWIFAIKLSVLTNVMVDLYPEEQRILKDLPNGYYNTIVDPQNHLTPTMIFTQIVSESPKQIVSLLNIFSNYVDIIFSRVRGEVHIFIDRVEQALDNLDQQAWIKIQGGLLEAGWIIYANNNHIKLHASIRQEAYTNYPSPTKANFSNSTMTLTYQEADLINILNQSANYYEHSSLSDFLGKEDFFNAYTNQNENPVQFILRHALNRPRDLVRICAQLSLHRYEPLVDTVLDTCNSHIIPEVFDEVKVFTECLADLKKRKAFLSLIPYNILSYEDVSGIFAQFNGRHSDTLSGIEKEDPDLNHPFKELFKAGLLGIINEDNIQKFRQPHDLENFQSFRLPKSKFYLMHPALRSYVSKQEKDGGYNTFKYIIIGHNQPWDDAFNQKMVSLQACLFVINNDELSGLAHRFLKGNLEEIRKAKPLRDTSKKEFELLVNKIDEIISSKAADPIKSKALQLFYILEEIYKFNSSPNLAPANPIS